MKTFVRFLSLPSLTILQRTYRLRPKCVERETALTLPILQCEAAGSYWKALHSSPRKEQAVPHMVELLDLWLSAFSSNKVCQAQLWNSVLT